MSVRESQRLDAVRRRHHGIAVCLERHAGQVPHHGGILDQQYRLRAGGHCGFMGDGLPRSRQVVHAREIDFERAAFSDLAVHGDRALVLLDDPVHCGQPKPRPLARLLGREERLEDPRLGGLIHAAPAIAHGENHVDAGLELPTGGGGLFTQFHVRGFDDERAPGWHGVSGVDGQFHPAP